MEALCAEHQINLIKVGDKKLGERVDREGKPREVVGCSCVVVKDYGKEAQAKDVIEEYTKRKNWSSKKTGLSFLKKQTNKHT